ncbi:MAG: transaldolase [Acidobacteria bacterium]|nr:transaldolase [Acidobacteriota bacterium]
MEIFLDTSNITEIRKWLRHGVVDGVTTNPSIMLKDGHRDLEAGAREITALVHPLPVSVEVYTNDPDEMLRQAREFATWAGNIVVKITIIDENGAPCLNVVKTLEGEGIRVNVTACLSLGQAMLAAKAGATFVSLFLGRINDEGNDGPGVIHKTRQWLDMWGYKSKIIAGSIRSVMDIQQAAMAGAHIITIPPEFMSKMVDHKYSRVTVSQFVNDGQRAFAEIEKARVR